MDDLQKMVMEFQAKGGQVTKVKAGARSRTETEMRVRSEGSDLELEQWQKEQDAKVLKAKKLEVLDALIAEAKPGSAELEEWHRKKAGLLGIDIWTYALKYGASMKGKL